MSDTHFQKDPSAYLDYAFDWSDWLVAGETITSFTVSAETGLTVASDGEVSGVVTAWLSGGTANRDYPVTCQITTSQGRIDERTITINVRDR